MHSRPLVWAHAEYIKLRRSLLEGEIFDQPPQPVERYQVQKKSAACVDWRFNNKISSMPQGKILRLTLLAPASVHWGFDGWAISHDTNARETGLGAYIVDLPTKQLPVGSYVCFT
jgi:glucoamylase